MFLDVRSECVSREEKSLFLALDRTLCILTDFARQAWFLFACLLLVGDVLIRGETLKEEEADIGKEKKYQDDVKRGLVCAGFNLSAGYKSCHSSLDSNRE